MHLRKGILVFAAVFGALGCTEEAMNLGNKWVEAGTRVILIDTCSVNISSIRLDSVKTSQGNVVYAGIRESEYFGRMQLSTYMNFKHTADYQSSSTPEYSERLIFDSLTLYMVTDNSFCGDTLEDMTLSAFRLAEELALNDDSELYSVNSFALEPDRIARKTIRPHPFRTNPVEIRLDDALGSELLDMVVNSEVSTDAEFRSWFKGLMLQAEDPAKCILGFEGQDSTCMLKLYYRTQSYAEPEEHVLDFKLDTTYMFTHVDANLSGSPLEGFADEDIEELGSGECRNLAFMSGMLGVYTRIGFPYLNNLRSLGDHCMAASAELRLYPLQGSFAKQNYLPLPETLNLYVSDENNISTGSAITNSDGSSLQSGSLTYDEMMFPESTYYTYDVTDFINSQFGKIGVNKNYLQMIDPDYGFNLNELVLGDRFTDGYNIKLTVALTTYNE